MTSSHHRSFSSGAPVSLSQVPGSASFRSSAVNAVAVIPLLSSDRNGHDDPTTNSSKSFHDLLDAFNRYNKHSNGHQAVNLGGDDLMLIVPNSNLTRPGDWRYDNTPLKNFHWGYGCQRIAVFDGRPYNSRMAHDRLMNHGLTRDWIDLCPHRRTAALIGVLNMRDCPDMATLQRAEQEWRQWAERYSTPPYEVTAHGRDFERDFVVQRLFVFDSFHESNKVKLNETSLGSSLVAFPPADGEHTHMMDLHMNVVVNDLAVAIFQELEDRIRESDASTKDNVDQPSDRPIARKPGFFQQKSTSDKDKDKDSGPQASSNLSLNTIASVVSPENKLATNAQPKRSSLLTKIQTMTAKKPKAEAQLLTPLDDVWDYSELSPKDAHGMLRREIGRREKFAADLSLLAGSPMDAYERYTKAAELCKTSTPDPLWYASALEGAAAAHIAMAEAGGFNVDQYLENSFQLPDEIMAFAASSAADKSRQSSSNKQTLPRVVVALCDEALNVTCRHPRLAPFHAELLLKLAWYCAEVEDTHVRCQWGLGEGCYGGETNSDARRWEKASMTQLNFLDLKTKEGDDVIALNTLQRCQKWTEFMHRAVSNSALDPVTRADVALRCSALCMKGLRPTVRPTVRERSNDRFKLPRKAAFFSMVAAEAMPELDEGMSDDDRATSLWLHASKQFSSKGGTSYGWATLRAPALHAIALLGVRDSSEEAALSLLALMGAISPGQDRNDTAAFLSKLDSLENTDDLSFMMDSSNKSESLSDTNSFMAESVVNAARSYVRTKAQDARARGATFFNSQTSQSSLLAVAQSKWVEDDPQPTLLLPLSDSSAISHSVMAMKCVWSKIRFENCVMAQKRLIEQISSLRKDLPVSSLSGSLPQQFMHSTPIRITSANIVKSESDSEIERVKVKSALADDKDKQGAMATFFNPYASKKKEGKEIAVVAQGEERYILVEFFNSLSIPLEIPRCQLQFESSQLDRIKAPAMSFVIPGQVKNFAVQFPFMILPFSLESQESGQSEESGNPNIFEVKGLTVTCLGRSFFLPIDCVQTNEQETEPLPTPGHLYPRRNYRPKPPAKGENSKAPRIEVVPAQPNLLVSFANSAMPIEETTVVPVPLSDGETFSVPLFRLTNDTGPSGRGTIEDFRITAHGLPGRSEVVLFELNPKPDTNENKSKTSKREGVVTPLKLSAICEGMDRETLNRNGSDRSVESTVSLQISAAHDFGAHGKGCNIKLRFRYKGNSSTPQMEFWRKREIQICVIRIKGPRISSLTFRPDLSWESSYSELCWTLANQNRATTSDKALPEVELPQRGSTDDKEFVISRLGMDRGVHSCADSVVVVLSVANETPSAIILSRPDSLVAGFSKHSIETIKVASGVSAKLPIIVPRLDRNPDICARLIANTILNWTSESDSEVPQKLETGGTMVPVNRRIRKGSMQMPAGCLKTIIDENPTFLSRIGKAPCRILVDVNGPEGASCVEVAPGNPVDVKATVALSDWIPEDVLSENKFTIEFCCARKRKLILSRNDSQRDYVWCGQLLKVIPTTNGNTTTTYTHHARIVFLHEGDYVLSACVNIKNKHSDSDYSKEVWLAEEAQHIHVKNTPLGQ